MCNNFVTLGEPKISLLMSYEKNVWYYKKKNIQQQISVILLI